MRLIRIPETVEGQHNVYEVFAAATGKEVGQIGVGVGVNPRVWEKNLRDLFLCRECTALIQSSSSLDDEVDETEKKKKEADPFKAYKDSLLCPRCYLTVIEREATAKKEKAKKEKADAEAKKEAEEKDKEPIQVPVEDLPVEEPLPNMPTQEQLAEALFAPIKAAEDAKVEAFLKDVMKAKEVEVVEPEKKENESDGKAN
jgi:rubredoxin